MEAAPHPWPALGVLLLRDGLVEKAELEEILAEQRDSRQQRVSGRRLGDVLIQRGRVTPTQVAKLVAEQYELPFVDFDVADIDLRVANVMREDDARRFWAIPISRSGDGSITLAIADPSTVLFSDEIRRLLESVPRFAVVGPDAIERAITFVYSQPIPTISAAPEPSESADDLIVHAADDLAAEAKPDPPSPTSAHSWPPLGALLVRDGLVTDEALETALAQQRLAPSLRLGEILMGKGLVSRSDVARLVAEQYELPFYELERIEIDPEVAQRLPEDLAWRLKAIPIEAQEDGSLRIAIADPTSAVYSDELRQALEVPLTFVVASPDGIEAALDRLHEPATETTRQPEPDLEPPEQDPRAVESLDLTEPPYLVVEAAAADVLQVPTEEDEAWTTRLELVEETAADVLPEHAEHDVTELQWEPVAEMVPPLELHAPAPVEAEVIELHPEEISTEPAATLEVEPLFAIELEVEIEPETVVETQVEVDVEQELEVEVELEDEALEAEVDVEPEPAGEELVVEAEVEVAVEPELAPEAEAEAADELEVEAETEVDVTQEREAEPEPEAEAEEFEAEADVELEADAVSVEDEPEAEPAELYEFSWRDAPQEPEVPSLADDLALQVAEAMIADVVAAPIAHDIFGIGSRQTLEPSSDDEGETEEMAAVIAPPEHAEEPHAAAEIEESSDADVITDAPVAAEFETAVADALAAGASTIHFSPRRDGLAVRARIDGLVHELGTVTFAERDALVERLESEGVVRSHVVQTSRGAKTTLFVRESSGAPAGLDDLALDSRAATVLRGALQRPGGAILVCGPAGSGTTTTLYALLEVLATPERVVATVEQPIERTVDGIDQIEVSPLSSATFASAVRELCLTDTDALLVGDLPDRETAEAALRAAYEGRLVLAGFRAPTAATGLLRLTNLGVDPAVLASSVGWIASQRLVRTVCADCRETYYATDEELELLRQPATGSPRLLVRGTGCASCGGTGFRGRTAIVEVMQVTDELRGLIADGVSTKKLQKAAVAAGMSLLGAEGARLCLDGVTTVSEFARVLGEGS